jgi:hypothetical protein
VDLKKMNSAYQACFVRHVHMLGLFCYSRPHIDISGADTNVTDASGAQQYLARIDISGAD